METKNGQNETKTNETQSPIGIKNQLGKDHQENLSNSEEPLNDLKGHWNTPINAKELAEQANKMATKLLNGEVDTQTAQRYSALVRGISQLLSLEVAKARLEKSKIDLNFNG